jgi:hypothetical protein
VINFYEMLMINLLSLFKFSSNLWELSSLEDLLVFMKTVAWEDNHIRVSDLHSSIESFLRRVFSVEVLFELFLILEIVICRVSNWILEWTFLGVRQEIWLIHKYFITSNWMIESLKRLLSIYSFISLEWLLLRNFIFILEILSWETSANMHMYSTAIRHHFELRVTMFHVFLILQSWLSLTITSW